MSRSTQRAPRVYNRPGKTGDWWYADVRTPDGRRIRHRLGHDRAEAERRALQLWKEHQPADSVAAEPVPVVVPNPSVEDVLGAFVNRCAVVHADKPATTVTARIAKRALLKKLDGKQRASKLTPGAIERYTAQRRAEGRSPHTVAKELRILRAALRHAVEEGWIDSAPKVRMPKGTTSKIQRRALNEAEAEKLLAAAPDPRTRALFALCWYAGLRKSEALWLRWEDVDLSAGRLRVVAKEGWTTKTHEERELPLGPKLAAELRTWKMRCAAGAKWVLPSKRGRDGRLMVPAKPVREAFKAAGLSGAELKPGLHALRRAWATRLIEKRVSFETVCRLGGWADVQTLLRWYNHSSEERKEEAMALC